MKKWLMSLGLMALLAQSALAFRPAGWVYFNYPWAYDNNTRDWYWFNTPDTQWVVKMGSGQWSTLPQSAMAQGWVYFANRYAFAQGNGAWHYINAVDWQWVVNMRTGAWSRFVGANGDPSGVIPRFVDRDYIEISEITQVSRFRSAVGHDYSDDHESCRSMKHYFMPSGTDWERVKIFSPVDGVIDVRWEEWAGSQIWIRSNSQPDFTFIIFHVTLNADYKVGDSVTAGQQIGTHVGNMTYSDIAVLVSIDGGEKLVSFFDVMSDSLFYPYYQRGVAQRSDVIISREERDADPLTCDGETFTTFGSLADWVTFD